MPHAALKRLLTREMFSTLEAMAMLELHEPRASNLMIDMARAGWLDYNSPDASLVDEW